LQRHCATEKRITRVTQSLALRSESSVSASPNPNGLTTPAAVTATRTGDFAFRTLPVSAIFEHEKLTLISIAFLKEAFYK
jgi:hypothetical protein